MNKSAFLVYWQNRFPSGNYIFHFHHNKAFTKIKTRHGYSSHRSGINLLPLFRKPRSVRTIHFYFVKNCNRWKKRRIDMSNSELLKPGDVSNNDASRTTSSEEKVQNPSNYRVPLRLATLYEVCECTVLVVLEVNQNLHVSVDSFDTYIASKPK